MIEIATVTPIRLVQKGNIIVCHRKPDLGLSQKLEQSVAAQRNVNDILADRIYGLKIIGKPWKRAMLKFVTADGRKVLQLVDESGVFDYDEQRMKLREVTDDDILKIPFGEMKCMVYGVGPYEFDDEFILIFNELLKQKETMAIFGLIEEKSSKVHDAYACDFLFLHKEKYNSFREVLIKEHITYPSLVREPLNRQIFMKRTEFLTMNNVRPRSLTLDVNSSRSAEVQFVLNERFNVYSLIGEGSVSKFKYIYRVL